MITLASDSDIPSILEIAKERLPQQWQFLEPELWKAFFSIDEILLVVKEGPTVLGYLLGSSMWWSGAKVAFIKSTAARRGLSSVIAHDVFASFEDWARSKGSTKLLAFTRVNPKLFVSSYGFTVSGSIITKELA